MLAGCGGRLCRRPRPTLCIRCVAGHAVAVVADGVVYGFICFTQFVGELLTLSCGVVVGLPVDDHLLPALQHPAVEVQGAGIGGVGLLWRRRSSRGRRRRVLVPR